MANNTNQYNEITARLYKLAQSHSIGMEDVESLRNILRYHEHRYYVLNDPLIADYEYDMLFKELERLEGETPSIITADSPTQRVAKGLTKEFPTVQHLVPMLSLDNSYNEEDLIDFDRKVKELSGLDQVEYCVEPKFDGVSISLVYDQDKLIRGATRGNGVEGDNVTINMKQIKTIPLSAPFGKEGLNTVEMRGEVLINKKNFAAYNEAVIEQGQQPLANPRNAAAGTLRIKDPAEVRRRNLEAFVYHITYTDPAQQPFRTHAQSLQLLWDMGFRSPVKEMRTCQNINEVIAYCNEYEEIRDSLPYEIDGMVIKVNDLSLHDTLGMTSHHPRWAIAFKFKARQATSTLLKVEYQVGRTGSVTPVAKIEPVPIGGVTVSSISLFNQDVIKEKDLRIGDTILVERAGDVIPYIVKSFVELRKGHEMEVAFPTTCPVCSSELFREEGEAVWRCINIECPAQVAERMIHYVSKDAMDIRGFGEANIKKFYELGLLKDIPGIYTLDFEKIGALEGFGKKSMDNLKLSIEQSKLQPMARLIFGLGIRFVGETTAKVLAQKITHLLDLRNYTIEDLMLLEDIGPKVAGSIVHFFSNEENVRMIQELEMLGVKVEQLASVNTFAEGKLTGLTFLFTGTLPTLKRSDAEAMAEKQGATILSGVSSKLNYLVVGSDAGSKLEKAKKLSSIKIIDEEIFLNLIR